MFLGLRTVLYIVEDIEAAKAWYTEVVGEPPYFDEPYYVGFEVGGYELGLVPVADGEHGNLGQVQAFWGVESIETEYERLRSLGAKEHRSIQEVGGDIRVCTFLDADGNIFGLIENPHFQAR